MYNPRLTTNVEEPITQKEPKRNVKAEQGIRAEHDLKMIFKFYNSKSRLNNICIFMPVPNYWQVGT